MRIAFVTPRYRPSIGGVEIHVERLATGLARAGHEVEVLTQAPRGVGLAAAEAQDAILVRRFPTLPGSGRNFAVAPRLAAFLRASSRSYDIVHAHNYHALPALMAARAARPPLVLTPHFHGVSESAFRNLLHRPYRLAGRYMMDRATRVISVSRAEAGLVSDSFPRAAAKIAVVPNGVDARALDAAAPFPRDGGKVVLSAGRLEGYKRVDLVIRALQQLDDSFALTIAGEGSARRELEALVGTLGSGDRVRFLGRVERGELDRWFRSADVFVSMSTIEAMGIASAEALQAGARVVASDIPAHRETAELGGERFALVARDAPPTELAAAIEAAATDTEKPLAGAVPSWDEVVARTEALYEEALV